MFSFEKKNIMPIFHYGIVFICGILSAIVSAQDSSVVLSPLAQGIECNPKVFFTKGKESIRLCLDNFVPSDDSCALVNFHFLKYGVSVRFNFTIDRHWVCTGTSVDSTEHRKPVFNASLSYDDNGILTEALFILDAPFDTSRMELEHSRDIISKTDTVQPFDYEISRNTFICNEKIIYGKLVIREYVYPAGYGEKGQILNYPELSAFHWGGSVRLPSGGGDMQVRAYTINYWHLQTPLPIEYDDPEKIQKYEAYLAKWRARHPPREKKVRERKSFLKIKSL